MRPSTRIVTLAALAVVVAAATHARAFPQFARQTGAACASCHTSPAGGKDLSEAGAAFKAEHTKAPAAGTGAEYVGVNKCKMCHMKIYKAWIETPHAKAWAALADTAENAEIAGKLKVALTGDARQNDACVVCHTIGFKLAGGYPQADSVKAAGLVNVGCEDCHGPGGAHVAAKDAAGRKAAINRNVTENMCKNCHVPELTPKFDFDAMKKKGVHAIAAAEPAQEPSK
jgi:formate-dependent nitrite reductase cytochrome c552 subunit